MLPLSRMVPPHCGCKQSVEERKPGGHIQALASAVERDPKLEQVFCDVTSIGTKKPRIDNKAEEWPR